MSVRTFPEVVPEQVTIPTASLAFVASIWYGIQAILGFYSLAPLSWSTLDYALNAAVVVIWFTTAMASLYIVDRTLKHMGVLD